MKMFFFSVLLFSRLLHKLMFGNGRVGHSNFFFLNKFFESHALIGVGATHYANSYASFIEQFVVLAVYFASKEIISAFIYAPNTRVPL